MFLRALMFLIMIIVLIWFFARPALTWIGDRITKNVGLDKREEEKRDELQRLRKRTDEPK